jgi:NADH dehydrogenase
MMILIAGGTGHMGPVLVSRLHARGESVRVLTRNPTRARARLGDTAELIEGDVRDMRSLQQAMRNVDSVVSAITGFGPGGAGTQEIDYKGNVNLISAAEAEAVSRFVLVSYQGAAPNSPMELARMKHRAELALRASTLDWTIVRPTPFMELWAGIVGAPLVKKGKTTVFGRGDNPVNFIAECDVAWFVEAALSDARLSRAQLDVGGPENLTLNELVHRFASLGKAAQVRHIPRLAMRVSSVLLRPVKPDIAGMIEAGIVMDTTDMRFDPSALRQRYPAHELTPISQVIEDMVHGPLRDGNGVAPSGSGVAAQLALSAGVARDSMNCGTPSAKPWP